MVPSARGLFKITARCRELIKNFHLRTNLILPPSPAEKMSNFNFTPLPPPSRGREIRLQHPRSPDLFVLEILVARQSEKPGGRRRRGEKLAEFHHRSQMSD